MKLNKITLLASTLVLAILIQPSYGMQIQNNQYNSSDSRKMTFFGRLMYCCIPCLPLQPTETIPLKKPDNAPTCLPTPSTTTILLQKEDIPFKKPDNAPTYLPTPSTKTMLLHKEDIPVSCLLAPSRRTGESGFTYFKLQPKTRLIHKKRTDLETIQFEKINLHFDGHKLTVTNDSQAYFDNDTLTFRSDNDKSESVALPVLSRYFWTKSSALQSLLGAKKYTILHLDSEGISLMCDSKKVELLHYDPHTNSYCDPSTHDLITIVGKTYEVTQKFIAVKEKPAVLKLKLIN